MEENSLPPMFVTNHPFEHNLEGTDFRISGIADSFQIPDWHLDAVFPQSEPLMRQGKPMPI